MRQVFTFVSDKWDSVISLGCARFGEFRLFFHRAGFHTSIVMLWEKQSWRTRICTQISKTNTTLRTRMLHWIICTLVFMERSSDWSGLRGSRILGIVCPQKWCTFYKQTQLCWRSMWCQTLMSFNHLTTGRGRVSILDMLCKTGQECARFPEFLQNFGERQILWNLCWVVFRALTLKSPIQNSLSVAPELPVCLCSGEKCPSFGKTSTPRRNRLKSPREY